MKKVSLIGILLLIFIASVGIGDDTCIFPPDQDLNAFVSFTAPVIPPSDTISGNFVYLALFRPMKGNFWEGNVVKFGLDEEGNIIDANGDPALNTQGNLKPDAVPIWATRNWANLTESNYVHNSNRKIYTYLGVSRSLSDSTNEFRSSNSLITESVLGNPTHTISEIIRYVRGADVFDEDADGDTNENRSFITGDVMHSSPLVVKYRYADGSSETYVFFGANDGMLHAVLDTTTTASGVTTTSGDEAWAFIPPDQLHKLKDLVEGTRHPYFVDSSPKAFSIDVDGDGVLDSADGDRIILICGERKGGSSYFALDITDPENPSFLWRISQSDDASSLDLPAGASPDVVIPQLGETWCEPVFGRVKTSDDDTIGTRVFFVGAGYSPDNTAGKAILAINPLDGSIARQFKNGVAEIVGMDFSIPSSVVAIDEDENGFTDKLYVGDTGGQIWRVGRFRDAEHKPLPFPHANENIMSWTAHRIFISGDPTPPSPRRKFFYPPTVALEQGYDLLLTGTGDRENPCSTGSNDRIYAIKDLHDDLTLTELDLVDVTDAPPVPDLDSDTADKDGNGYTDRGWYIRLAPGEKVLEKGLLFNKVYYVPTFTPDSGLGESRIYALQYKTGAAAGLFTDEGMDTWSRVIGVGISSKPVLYVGRSRFKLFSSTGTSYVPAPGSPAASKAAILEIEPLAPPSNLFYLWWMVF